MNTSTPSANNSATASFQALTPTQKTHYLDSLTDEEFLTVKYDWYGFWARQSQQIPSGLWSVWLILAGRGFGKSRCGAEWVIDGIRFRGFQRTALVGRTWPDIRDVMVEGESGILACSPPDFQPIWEPSKHRLTWPNGAQAFGYSADEPGKLAGPQHDSAWGDEAAIWYMPREIGEKTAWDNLMFGLRLTTAQGAQPQAVVTTTPRRGPMLARLLKSAGLVITRGSTYDNRDNLARSFFSQIISVYEGTRLGQQELYGELLEDNPDALWRYADMIDALRRDAPRARRQTVVAVDPEAVSTEESAETGIIVAARGTDGHGYVLADETVRGTPLVWATRAVQAYHDWDAQLLIAEVNQGGEMVEAAIRMVDPHVRYRAVRATKGKLLRAEPISALYEQGRVHHCGVFAALESQMTQWMPGQRSPDRLDALVWGLTALLVNTGKHGRPVAGTPRPAPTSAPGYYR